MGIIETIKLVLALLPLVIEAIKAVEKLFPATGQGSEKKAMIMKMIEDSDPNAYQQTSSVLSGVIDKSVSIMNKTGAFK